MEIKTVLQVASDWNTVRTKYLAILFLLLYSQDNGAIIVRPWGPSNFQISVNTSTWQCRDRLWYLNLTLAFFA